ADAPKPDHPVTRSAQVRLLPSPPEVAPRGHAAPQPILQKLHLVGFTKDHDGLILSARRGTRSGGYMLAIDAALAEAVAEAEARREEAEAEIAPERPPRVESTLSVKEIQARL